MNTPLTAKEAEELQHIADLANGSGAYVNTVSRAPEIPEDILDHLSLTLERVDSYGDGTVTLVYLNDKGEEVKVETSLNDGLVGGEISNSLNSLKSTNVMIDGWGEQLKLKLRKDKGRRLL